MAESIKTAGDLEPSGRWNGRNNLQKNNWLWAFILVFLCVFCFLFREEKMAQGSVGCKQDMGSSMMLGDLWLGNRIFLFLSQSRCAESHIWIRTTAWWEMGLRLIRLLMFAPPWWLLPLHHAPCLNCHPLLQPPSPTLFGNVLIWLLEPCLICPYEKEQWGPLNSGACSLLTWIDSDSLLISDWSSDSLPN